MTTPERYETTLTTMGDSYAIGGPEPDTFATFLMHKNWVTHGFVSHDGYQHPNTAVRLVVIYVVCDGAGDHTYKIGQTTAHDRSVLARIREQARDSPWSIVGLAIAVRPVRPAHTTAASVHNLDTAMREHLCNTGVAQPAPRPGAGGSEWVTMPNISQARAAIVAYCGDAGHAWLDPTIEPENAVGARAVTRLPFGDPTPDWYTENHVNSGADQLVRLRMARGHLPDGSTSETAKGAMGEVEPVFARVKLNDGYVRSYFLTEPEPEVDFASDAETDDMDATMGGSSHSNTPYGARAGQNTPLVPTKSDVLGVTFMGEPLSAVAYDTDIQIGDVVYVPHTGSATDDQNVLVSRLFVDLLDRFNMPLRHGYVGVVRSHTEQSLRLEWHRADGETMYYEYRRLNVDRVRRTRLGHLGGSRAPVGDGGIVRRASNSQAYYRVRLSFRGRPPYPY